MKPTPYQLVDAHNFQYNEEPMTTPEGRVKKNIRRILDAFDVYYLMPVQMGRGAAGVDFHAVVKVVYPINNQPIAVAVAFFIEAKKPGGEPTDRQDDFLKDRREKQNAKTFVIDDDPSIGEGSGGIEELVQWLEMIEENNERVRAQYNTEADADV